MKDIEQSISFMTACNNIAISWWSFKYQRHTRFSKPISNLLIWATVPFCATMFYSYVGNCNKFYFTFQSEQQMRVQIFQNFKKDQIPSCHLSHQSNPNTDKPIDIQIIPNQNEFYLISEKLRSNYYLQVFIILLSASYFTICICKYIV